MINQDKWEWLTIDPFQAFFFLIFPKNKGVSQTPPNHPMFHRVFSMKFSPSILGVLWFSPRFLVGNTHMFSHPGKIRKATAAESGIDYCYGSVERLGASWRVENERFWKFVRYQGLGKVQIDL